MATTKALPEGKSEVDYYAQQTFPLPGGVPVTRSGHYGEIGSFAAMNTVMYAAASPAREIGTLGVLGFNQHLLSFVLESPC